MEIFRIPDPRESGMASGRKLLGRAVEEAVEARSVENAAAGLWFCQPGPSHDGAVVDRRLGEGAGVAVQSHGQIVQELHVGRFGVEGFQAEADG